MIAIDIPSQLAAIYREVGERHAGEAVGVLMRRSYGAAIEDVWSAVTDPERMRRWFLPVSGDLRLGGTFQLHGNAGGEILTCQPPTLLRVTFGGPTSVVELRLSPNGEETVLELEHVVPFEVAQSAAGALYVGPGWDGALMGLDLYLRGEAPPTRPPRRTRWRCRSSPSSRCTSGSPPWSRRAPPAPTRSPPRPRCRWRSSRPMSS
jgi:uncharacterized protein YndB with AHSA1/START domain